MSKAQHVITAVVLEGPSKSEVARDYDVSRYCVQQLCRRYQARKGFDAGDDTIATHLAIDPGVAKVPAVSRI